MIAVIISFYKTETKPLFGFLLGLVNGIPEVGQLIMHFIIEIMKLGNIQRANRCLSLEDYNFYKKRANRRINESKLDNVAVFLLVLKPRLGPVIIILISLKIYWKRLL